MKKALFLILVVCFMPMTFIQAQELDYYNIEDTLTEGCQSTLKKWNDALNARDMELLSSTYNFIVNYYQSNLTHDQVDASHARFFDKHAYYHQYYDNVSIDFINGCQAQLSFDKHVQTEKDGPYKTYNAYMHFIYAYEEGTLIIGENDETTDANLRKRELETLDVDNDTPLDAIFCKANVGKRLSASYWELVDYGDKEDGPLADFILTSGFPRSYINGIIKTDYEGQKGTYSCDGYAVAGECQWPVIFTYNPATREMYCIGGEEE